MDLYVPHVLPLAFEQSLRILQGGSVEEAKLHKRRIGVHVCHGSLASDPAAVSPLHGLAQLGLDAFHEPSERTDDRLVLLTLGLQVFIEARIRLHFSHTVRRRIHRREWHRDKAQHEDATLFSSCECLRVSRKSPQPKTTLPDRVQALPVRATERCRAPTAARGHKAFQGAMPLRGLMVLGSLLRTAR